MAEIPSCRALVDHLTHWVRQYNGVADWQPEDDITELYCASTLLKMCGGDMDYARFTIDEFFEQPKKVIWVKPRSLKHVLSKGTGCRNLAMGFARQRVEQQSGKPFAVIAQGMLFENPKEEEDEV